MGSRHHRLAALFLTALVVQIICVYLRDLWVVGDSFLITILLARTLLPWGMNAAYFKFPLKGLGIGLPKVSRRELLVYLSLPLLIVVIVWIVHFSASYLQYYQNMREPGEALSIKLWQFTWFTLSTLPAWELLHRGFLLFGLRNILERDYKIKKPDAWAIAIPIVCSFEVLYHLQKPAPEPLGLLLASPIFSLIALRTESVLIPLALHLIIEAVFFLAVTT